MFFERNPFEQELGSRVVAPLPRRGPQHAFYCDLDGHCEVVTSEPGGSQRATWTRWRATPKREPSLTVFEHPDRAEPTQDFKDLIERMREMNDPSPNLLREDVRQP